jgi:hypothetical protein
MAQITITLSESYEVPEGTVVVHSEKTGFITGLRLPSGEFIKPWITFEQEVDGGEAHRDLNGNEIMDLGIHPALDFDRAIEGDIELSLES